LCQFKQIVRDIVRHLNQYDLQPCRVVCALWNEEACKVLQQTRTVTFVDNEAIEKYSECFEPGAEVSPHSKYQFYHVALDRNNTLEKFLKSFGHKIKTLILQQRVIPARELYGILHRLPNVDSLWLRSIPTPFLAQPGSLPADTVKEWMQRITLRSCPNYVPEIEDWDTSGFLGIRHLTLGAVNETIRSGFPFGVPVRVVDDGVYWAERRQAIVRLLTRLPKLQTVSLATLDSARYPEICRALLRCIVDAVATDSGALRNLTLINFPIVFQTDTFLQDLVNLR